MTAKNKYRSSKVDQASLKKVIAQYQNFSRSLDVYWEVQRKRHQDPEIEEIATTRSFEVLGIASEVDEFMHQVAPDTAPDDVNFQQFLDAYLASMRDDIFQCLDTEQQKLLNDFELCFLKTGMANAYCVNADVFGKPLDYFIAFINEGLYFALNQLFTGLIFEEMQGDLAKYRRDGKSAFEAAITLYLEPTSNNIEQVPLHLGDPEVDGELQAHLSSVTTIVLLFVCLHEFAHAFLKHHAIVSDARLSMLGDKKKNEAFEQQEETVAHNLEYEADEFAFRALMSRTQTAQSNWAHYFVLHLFFRYLEAIEKRTGNAISETHPAPETRAQRLKELLISEFPEDSYFESDIVRLDQIVEKWTKQ